MLPPRLRRLRYELRPYRPLLRLVLAVVGLSALWVAVTGVLAARDLDRMRADATQLEAAVRDDTATAASVSAVARRAAEHGRAAAHRTDDVVWKVWQRAPLAGRPLTVLSNLTRAAAQASDGPVTTAAETAQRFRKARQRDGSFDLKAVEGQQRVLAQAAASAAAARDLADDQPSTGLGPLDRGRARVAQVLRSLATTLDALRTAAEIGPSALGGSGDRRYLVAVQNNAEARAAGGIVGAYGILSFSEGRPTLSRFRSDASLLPLDHNAVDLGPEWRRRYDFLGQARDWREVTATPDFPTAATEMLGLWAGTHQGQRLDGVLSMDPVALSDVLRATGPVREEDGRVLTADRFVDYSLSRAYALFPNKKRRTEALADAAHAVFAAVVQGRGPSATLAERLGHAVLTRHLAFYSAHADEERVLRRTRIAQALPTTSSPALGVVTQEASGTKLSYYLRREISYVAQPVTTSTDLGSGPESVQRATLRIRLTNTAPASGLPDYVAPGNDHATGAPVARGTYRMALSVYLARRGGFLDAARDGKALSLESQTEQGMTVLTTTLSLAPGASTVLVLDVLQPAAAGAELTWIPQPLAHPDVLLTRVP